MRGRDARPGLAKPCQQHLPCSCKRHSKVLTFPIHTNCYIAATAPPNICSVVYTVAAVLMAKPGRKPKYITEEERQLAKREQINRAVRKYRAKKKVIFVKPVAARLTSADPAEAITSIPTSSPPNIENALHHFRASSIQLIDLRDDDLITNNLVEDFLRDSPEWWWPVSLLSSPSFHLL